MAEAGTRFGNYLGETFGGQPFEIFPSIVSPNITDFGGPTLNFPVFSNNFGGSGAGANGGFLIYPNKSNTNMARTVYSK